MQSIAPKKLQKKDFHTAVDDSQSKEDMAAKSMESST